MARIPVAQPWSGTGSRRLRSPASPHSAMPAGGSLSLHPPQRLQPRLFQRPPFELRQNQPQREILRRHRPEELGADVIGTVLSGTHLTPHHADVIAELLALEEHAQGAVRPDLQAKRALEQASGAADVQ